MNFRVSERKYIMVDRVLSNSERQNVMLRKTYLHIRMALQVATFCILLGPLDIVAAQKSKSALSVEDVNALIPVIEAAEKSLFKNLKVDSETWVDTKADLSDPCEPWQRTPIYISCTAWFGEHPKGKARVDVHKEILKWRDGAAPYAESSYSVGFDGQYGRVVHYARGHSGKTFSLKEGKLLTDAPSQLTNNFLNRCTGARYSLYFLAANKAQSHTFSQLFRAATSPDALKAKAFEFGIEEFQGAECIKFGSGEQEGGHETWWFDPERGFALLGHEHVSMRNGKEWLISRIKVSNLKEVAPGIWWPTEAYEESGPFSPGEPCSRSIYRVSGVVANDPNFDESVFTVPFPKGYLIEDKVHGSTYRVGEDPNNP